MIKRVILSLALLAGIGVSAGAQDLVIVDDFTPPVSEVLKPYSLSIGPKVGVNFAIAGNPQDMDINMKGNVGFSAGAAGNIRFGRPEGRPWGTERFGVQLEVLYAMRNLKTDVKNITMNCFEIPVLFQWYFLPMFAIEAGPTFTGSFPSSPKEFDYNNTVYQMTKMKAYDIMVSLGVNCQLKNGFTADLRYNIGTSDLAGNFKAKVSTISIGIGWLFNVIK